MKVRDLMTPNPVCAEPDMTVEEIATLMKDEDIGCVPVLDEDGVSTSLQAFNNCLALLPVGLLPPDRVEWHRLPCCVDRACTRVSVDRGEIRPR